MSDEVSREAIEFWKRRIAAIADVTDTFIPQFVGKDERIFEVAYFNLKGEIDKVHVVIKPGKQIFTHVIGYAVKELVEHPKEVKRDAN
jgi:hypothetical protein